MSQPAQQRIAPLPTGYATPMNQAFLQMPILRQRILRPNAHHKLGRPEYDAATIAHTIGQEQFPACTRCQSSRGPFVACVTVRGHFEGLCTNCKYAGAFHACSFRSAAPAVPATPAGPAVAVAAAAVAVATRTGAFRLAVARAVVAGRVAGSRGARARSLPRVLADQEPPPPSPQSLAFGQGFMYPDPDHYTNGMATSYAPFWKVWKPLVGEYAEEEEVEEMEEMEEEAAEDDDDDDDEDE